VRQPLPVSCGAMLIRGAGLVGMAGGLRAADEKPAVKAGGPTWEVRLADGKVQKVTVVDETITLDTSFGSLKIPSKDVKRIEFGIRYSETEKKLIGEAVGEVTAADARTREHGKDVLLQFGPKGYPLVLRLSQKVQTNPHLIQVLDKLKAGIPEQDETLRDCDMIYTADESKLAGTLASESVRVKVGDAEKAYKWTDARILVNGASASLEEKLEIVTIGQNGVMGLTQTHFDKVVGIQVTGQIAGSVWGTGPYTTDSDLGTAAVHNGALKVGETAVIKVRVKADVGGYQGGTQNGVTTNNWGTFQGCYEILGKQKK
jgi:LCCL domain